MANKIERREFLALMGLGGAAATVGCGSSPKFEETWVPWVEPVAGTIPYVPNYYATTTRESEGAGLWVKVLGGRAVKVEGNPDHPVNKGTLTARQQSVIQGLYGTSRIRVPFGKNEGGMTWRDTSAKLNELMTANRGNIVALTGPVSGAEAEIWQKFVAETGGRHVTYEAFCQSGLVLASEKVFGQQKAPYFSLKGADYVLSLGAQFLESWGDVTALSRDYAHLRTPDQGKRGKHVQVEARMSNTGANADEVLHARPGSKTVLALALLKEVAAGESKLNEADKATVASMVANASIQSAVGATGLSADQIRHIAEDLLKHNSVVLPAEDLELAGDHVTHHAAVLLLNKALGGIGKHVNYSAGKPIERTSSHKAISELVAQMNSGGVGLLLIHGTNPAYSLPTDLNFAAAMGKTTSVVFADSFNETTALGSYVVPVNHDLEAWGEINTYEGVDMLMQPVMTPRWDMRQAHDILVEMIRTANPEALPQENFRDFLKASWITRFGGEAANPDKFWRDSLRAGGRFSMPEQGEDLPLSGNMDASMFANVKSGGVTGTALVLEKSARFGDGTTSDRGWLQELPDPMTGLVWDSWLEVSQETAAELGATYDAGARGGDAHLIKVDAGGQSVELPAFIVETGAREQVTLATGYGHTGLSETYNGRGVNAFGFLSSKLSDGEQFTAGPLQANLANTQKTYRMATVHLPGIGDQQVTPYSMLEDVKMERDLYQTVGLASLGHEGGHHGGGHYETLNKSSRFPVHEDKDWYPDRTDDPVYVDRDETFYDDYKWEAAFDLNRCTGCGSCVTACYAENNLPVVGKDQVARGREMAWIRINRYMHHHKSEDGHGKVTAGFLPMMCQQCANAPCESVCPSLATYHNAEGLNAMVYNRCVGTRYCANNCSYKVRRFNWFTFQWEGDLNWALNPAVTVRQMGVMEKCTFCVQRIRDAKDGARDQGRKVRDGEVRTACQQACPADAIRFGNYEDAESEVHKWAHDERAYRALDSHIHTKPGVSYLKRVVLDGEHHG
ncbi:MAG: 4Fe-4S dicluster domain-containing protein [Acidobacteriota bacterium]|nr:4Fe-4S dicluster domain-containing protein [Acidobacteriota bacterium]